MTGLPPSILALIGQGRLAEARALLADHIAVHAEDAAALTLLGKLDFQLGRVDAGIAGLERARHLAPEDVDLAYSLGTVYLAVSRFGLAVAELGRCLRLAPAHADAQYNLGCALRQLGRDGEAADAFAAAVAIRPDHVQARFNQANALAALGRFDEAVRAYEATLAQAPDSVDVLINLGGALRSAGRSDEAELILRRALALRTDARGINELANLLATTGKTAEAEQLYLRALALAPLDAATLVNLSFMLQRQNRLEDMEELLEQAVAAHPGEFRLWNALGLLRMWQSDMAEAENAFVRAITLKPDYGAALSNMGNVCAQRGQTEKAAEWFRRALAIEPENAAIHSNLLFNLLHGASQLPPEDVFAEHRRFGQVQEALVTPMRHARPAPEEAERRLKVGFMSPDFRDHSMIYFVEPVLRALDRSQVEMVLYYTRDLIDPVTERLRALADHWRHVSGLPPVQVAAMIAADGIDILIDLAGHTAGNMLPVFARKPAPIQMTWLGYPATTGLTRMDYRLLGRQPTELDHRTNTERLLAAGGTVFEPPAAAPEVTPPPMLSGRPPMLGSMNRSTKVGEECFATWCRILRQHPQCRLTMMCPGNSLGEAEAEWAPRFAAEGIDFARIVLEPKRPLREFLELFGGIDIALDPFPYSGGTTTMLTAWMGVPQVSLRAEENVGGTGAWTMSQLGCADLTANTPDEYVAAVGALLSDPQRMVDIRSTLRARMLLTLAVGQAAGANELCAALRAAWRRYVAQGSSDR